MADLPEQLGKLSLRESEEAPKPPSRTRFSKTEPSEAPKPIRRTRVSKTEPSEAPKPSEEAPKPPRRTRASKTEPSEAPKPFEEAPKPPRRTRASTKIIEEDPCPELRGKGFLERSSPVVKYPVAIFIIGPVASGKTTTLKTILPKDFKYDYYNLDDYHEYLLEQHMFIKTDTETQKKVKNMVEAATNKLYKKELEKNPGISKEDFIKTLTQEDLVKEYNSMFNTLLSTARKCIEQDVETLLSPGQENKNIVIDTTGGNYAKINHQIAILRSRGYKPIMIALYSSLDTTKKRNEERYRTVPSGGIYSSWSSTISNIPSYKNILLDDFYLLNTDPAVMKHKIDVRIKEELFTLYFNNKVTVKQEINDKISRWSRGQRMSDTIPRSKISIKQRKAVSL